MEEKLVENPNVWQFSEMIWKDHPYIFVLIILLILINIGAIRNKTSIYEYMLNGLTPKFLKKKNKSEKK